MGAEGGLERHPGGEGDGVLATSARADTISTGLYCLREASGEWAPSVLSILPSALTAEIDFTTGSAEVVGAGRWRVAEGGIIVDDVVRDADGKLRKRHRWLVGGKRDGRSALTDHESGLGTSRPAGGPLTYVFVSDDCTVDVRDRNGTFKERPVSHLIGEFWDANRAHRRSSGHPSADLQHRKLGRAGVPLEEGPSVMNGASMDVDLGRKTVPPASTAPADTLPAAGSGPSAPPRRRPLPAPALSPYADNAFRILGLATSADTREIGRRARELAMVASLDGDDEGARRIRDAESALTDPVRRSADALLWLRIEVGGASSDLDPSDARAVGACLDRLAVRARQGDEAAIHDLAVIAHAAALEDACAPLARWHTGLAAWGSLIAHDRFWRAERMRADLTGDPRLQGAAVDAQRAELPWRLLEPTARVIAELVEAGRDDDALPRLAAIAESGLPPADISRARALATAGLRSALTVAERTVDEALDAFDRDKNSARLFGTAEPVAVEAVKTVRRLAQLDPGGPEAAVRADALAERLRTASVRLHNEADGTAMAVIMVERATQIAASSSVRERLISDSRTLRRLDLRRRANDLAGREDWEGATSELTSALQYTDDPADRADLQGQIATCKVNAAMRRAVRAAEAKDWAGAITAAEAALPHIADPQERAGITGFIARCRQALAASNPPKGSGFITAIWGVTLALTLLSFTSIVADNRPFFVDGNTVRIRAVRGERVSGSIPTGKSLDRRIAYPSGLQLVAANTSTGERHQQLVLPSSQPNWSDTIRTRNTSGDQAVSTEIAVRIPNLDGGSRRLLRGQISGNTIYPAQLGANGYENRTGRVALEVQIEVLDSARGMTSPFFGTLGLMRDWWGFVAIALVYVFFKFVSPWTRARFRRT